MLLMSFGDRFVSRVFCVLEVQKQLEIQHCAALCSVILFVCLSDSCLKLEVEYIRKSKGFQVLW